MGKKKRKEKGKQKKISQPKILDGYHQVLNQKNHCSNSSKFQLLFRKVPFTILHYKYLIYYLIPFSVNIKPVCRPLQATTTEVSPYPSVITCPVDSNHLLLCQYFIKNSSLQYNNNCIIHASP